MYFAKRKNTFELSFYWYLLFFISTVGYFYFGTNDALFFIGLIIYLNEINYKLEEYEFKEERTFNIRRLRAIEGVMITQGKKTRFTNKKMSRY